MYASILAHIASHRSLHTGTHTHTFDWPSGGFRIQFLEFLQLSLYWNSLLCTHCTNSRSRGHAKNQLHLSNPWRAECSEGAGSGHEKRSGRCRALNATAPMCDNLVWLPRACTPGGVRSKKAIRTALFLSDCGARQRARSTRLMIILLLFLQKRNLELKGALEVHFRGQHFGPYTRTSQVRLHPCT